MIAAAAVVRVPAALARKLGLESPTDQLPSWAWPGGYPIVYADAAGDTLCPMCANRSLVDDGFTAPVVDGDVYWEGAPMACDECGAVIESAHGNPFCECGAVLPADPVEVDGVAYCDACASLCELCEQGALISGGLVAVVDDDTGTQGLICPACAMSCWSSNRVEI